MHSVTQPQTWSSLREEELKVKLSLGSFTALIETPLTSAERI